MAKEDLFLASERSNNEYLGSVIPLFQTVSLESSVDRGATPYRSAVHGVKRSSQPSQTFTNLFMSGIVSVCLLRTAGADKPLPSHEEVTALEKD